MAVPRNRHSNARKNKRRSHLAKQGFDFVKCSTCSSFILPHRVCATCGYYRDKQIFKVDSDSISVDSNKPNITDTTISD